MGIRTFLSVSVVNEPESSENETDGSFIEPGGSGNRIPKNPAVPVDSELDGDGLGVFIILAGPEGDRPCGSETGKPLREKSPGSGDEGRAGRKKGRGGENPFSSVISSETEGRVVVHLLFEEGDIAHDTGAVLE
jgi:hypothetical protein